jgi:hypothetical protein
MTTQLLTESAGAVTEPEPSPAPDPGVPYPVPDPGGRTPGACELTPQVTRPWPGIARP